MRGYGRCPWPNALPDKGAAREKMEQAMEETEAQSVPEDEMLLTATLWRRGEGV